MQFSIIFGTNHGGVSMGSPDPLVIIRSLSTSSGSALLMHVYMYTFLSTKYKVTQHIAWNDVCTIRNVLW